MLKINIELEGKEVYSISVYKVKSNGIKKYRAIVQNDSGYYDTNFELDKEINKSNCLDIIQSIIIAYRSNK
jgi:hypothetical protein